ncbi:MAG: hypothetical protein V4528_11955 [Pseudomonadota bacterium]
MRDEFVEKTKRVIQDRAGNRCSNPECRVLTSGPNAHPERSTKTGVAAHITAASAGGPRYNPNLTSDQRQSAENGLWLCQNCAHFVDTDYLNYSVELLDEWKCLAEKEADDETKGRSGRLPSPPQAEPEKLQQEGWGCPFCGTVVEFGKSVCLGCHAEVVPGLTRSERQDAVQMGMMAGGGVAFVLLVVIPNWLKSSHGLNVELLWGLGIYGIALAAIIVLAVGFAVVNFSLQKRLQEPPRFFRHTVK